MTKTDIIKDVKVTEALSEAVQLNLTGRMCHMAGGKWLRNDVIFTELSSGGIVCQIFEEDHPHLENLQISQPVGMSFQIEHEKFIFDSIVLGFDSQVNIKGGRILLEIPERIEKMPRRGYERQGVPSTLHVQVLFWHRGYVDNHPHMPIESYWQGQMVNLSAGGCQIALSKSLADCFMPGQLVGLQFTPMFYQKPILVEGQVIHIKTNESSDKLNLGIEFLGLEVSIDGRTILHRLLDVVEEYAQINKNQGICNDLTTSD